MTSAQVVETSVTNNSSFQNYTHPDDHTIRTKETIAGFQNKSVLELHLIKPFIAIHLLEKNCFGLCETLLIVKMALMNVNDLKTFLNACRAFREC